MSNITFNDKIKICGFPHWFYICLHNDKLPQNSEGTINYVKILDRLDSTECEYYLDEKDTLCVKLPKDDDFYGILTTVLCGMCDPYSGLQNLFGIGFGVTNCEDIMMNTKITQFMLYIHGKVENVAYDRDIYLKANLLTIQKDTDQFIVKFRLDSLGLKLLLNHAKIVD